MAKYLVTGGAGFVGSHLTDRLTAQGHYVRVLDNLSTGSRENLSGDVELLIGDVADSDVVSRALVGCEGVFHLAAVASVQRSNEEWIATHRANQTGSVVVFEAARNAGRIPVVYASSAAVYGDNDQLPLSEAAATRPLTAYGADKLGSELHARVAWRVHSVPTAGLRFFNVFGPRQDPRSPYSGVISVFARNVRGNKPLVLHGDGQQTRDFIFVSDIVQFLVSSMDLIAREPQAIVMNACTGRSVSIETVAREIVAARRDLAIEYAPARAGDIRHSVGDAGLAKEKLRFSANVTFSAGLLKTLEGGDA